MLKLLAPVIFSAFLPACFGNSVALEPRAHGVTLVHESDRPLHCKALGRISGTSTSDEEKGARAGAENDFRNQAAELKGNFALVEAARGGPVGTSSERNYFIGGKALLCQTEAMEDAQEKAEAKAQRDKEDEEEQRQLKEASEKKEHQAPQKDKKAKRSK